MLFSHRVSLFLLAATRSGMKLCHLCGQSCKHHGRTHYQPMLTGHRHHNTVWRLLDQSHDIPQKMREPHVHGHMMGIASLLNCSHCRRLLSATSNVSWMPPTRHPSSSAITDCDASTRCLGSAWVCAWQQTPCGSCRNKHVQLCQARDKLSFTQSQPGSQLAVTCLRIWTRIRFSLLMNVLSDLWINNRR
jgi:hypothetical protein